MLRILLLVSFLFAHVYSENSCRYNHPTRGVIDLSTVGNQVGIPRFNDLTLSAASSYVYSFNPCYSFSEQACQNVAACRITKNRQTSDVLGIQSRSTWTIDPDGNAVLVYNQTKTTLSVTMICSADGVEELQLIGEGPVNRYKMILKSRCACWNGCSGSQPTEFTTAVPPATSTQTVQSNSCRYYDSQQGYIDLSEIAKRTGRARFRNIRDANSSSIRWSYNPCVSFTQQDCHHVAACRIDKDTHSSVSIAAQEKLSWINMNGNDERNVPSIVYHSTLVGQKHLRVELICDNTTSEHRLEVIGDFGEHEYLMRLTSRCACWNGCEGYERFEWKLWMYIASAGMIIFSFICCLMTCTLCCQKKKKRRSLVINEKTRLHEKA